MLYLWKQAGKSEIMTKLINRKPWQFLRVNCVHIFLIFRTLLSRTGEYSEPKTFK